MKFYKSMSEMTNKDWSFVNLTLGLLRAKDPSIFHTPWSYEETRWFRNGSTVDQRRAVELVITRRVKNTHLHAYFRFQPNIQIREENCTSVDFEFKSNFEREARQNPKVEWNRGV